MKLPLLLPALLAATLVVAGCDHAAQTIAGHSHAQHEQTGATTTLALDNGEKWLMDEHTRNKMAEMEAAFYSADHSQRESLNALGVSLSKDVEELVAGCTMEGKAHDQLHVFLTDYIPAVQSMSTADTLDEARDLAINIKGQLDNYKQHFK